MAWNDCTNPGLVAILPPGTLDGILRTFDLFTAYNPGYFVVDIMASDLVGHNDTAIVGIYILRDDQRVKIIINEIPDKVRQFEEEFISLLSNITGAIVNTDDVQVTGCLRGCFEGEVTSHTSTPWSTLGDGSGGETLVLLSLPSSTSTRKAG